MSGKFTGNINILAERSLRPESSQNILSKERISGPAEFWGNLHYSRCWHFEQINLPNISSPQPTLLKKDQTLFASSGSTSTFHSPPHSPIYFPPIFASVFFSTIFLSIFHAEERHPCSRQSDAAGTSLRATPSQASSIIATAINLFHI